MEESFRSPNETNNDYTTITTTCHPGFSGPAASTDCWRNNNTVQNEHKQPNNHESFLLRNFNSTQSYKVTINHSYISKKCHSHLSNAREKTYRYPCKINIISYPREQEDDYMHIQLQLTGTGKWIGFGLGEPTSGGMRGKIGLLFIREGEPLSHKRKV